MAIILFFYSILFNWSSYLESALSGPALDSHRREQTAGGGTWNLRSSLETAGRRGKSGYVNWRERPWHVRVVADDLGSQIWRELPWPDSGSRQPIKFAGNRLGYGSVRRYSLECHGSFLLSLGGSWRPTTLQPAGANRTWSVYLIKWPCHAVLTFGASLALDVGLLAAAVAVVGTDADAVVAGV